VIVAGPPGALLRFARGGAFSTSFVNLSIDGGHNVRSAATDQVMDSEARTDREILLTGDAAGFAVFYDRHAEWVLAFARRRSTDAESAADVTAEVFAAALAARRRYRSESPSAHAWLLAIARNKLNSTLRSGYAERRARTRLGMRPVEVTEDDVARIDALAEAAVVATLLEELPAEQRAAVVARVVDERDYADIAVGEGVSETVVRKRVSRGLAGLRRRWEERA
jgi:RNA polymerase sigma-70 factor (ECF subfamily)